MLNSDKVNLRDQVIRKVKQSLGTDAERKSGCVLYNGWRTLCPGEVYAMGLNPGGYSDRAPSIIQSLQDEKLEKKDFSSYDALKDPWEWHKKEMYLGWEHPHQRRVKELARCLNIGNVADLFAANAIFVRSVGQDSLERPEEIWEKCWPVHQLFLSIVQPKIILCLGNGDSLSAFTLLHNTIPSAQVKRRGEGIAHVVKWFTSDIDLGSYESLPCCLVVGVPHPSRFNVSPNVKEFLQSRVSYLATSH